MSNKDIIEYGMLAAKDYIKKCTNYKIIETDYKNFAGSFDIIAVDEDEECIHFIEVRSRLAEGKGFDMFKITPKKRQRCEATAELYLMREWEGRGDYVITFDIMSVNLLSPDTPVGFIRIYQNALSAA